MPQHQLFDGASEETRVELARRGQQRVFRVGEALFHYGDRATELFLVKDGRVKLWRAFEGGTSLTLAYNYPGALIGMVAAAQDRPHSVTATATAEVAALSWGATFIRDLLTRDPVLAANIAAVLAGRAELLAERMEEVSLASVDQRVARALVRLTAEIGRDGDGQAIHLHVTQSEVAELAQTTVPTVSRLMGRWNAAGFTSTGRGEITIHRIDRLCALGGLDG